MSSLSTLANRPRSITLAGTTYQLAELTLNDLGDLEAWVASRMPDPLALTRQHIDTHRVPMEQAKYLYAEALKEASRVRVTIGSPEAVEVLNSPDGIIEMLVRMVERGGAAADRNQLRDLVRLLTVTEVRHLQRISGLADVMAEGPDPNSPAAGSPLASPAATPSTGGPSTTP